MLDILLASLGIFIGEFYGNFVGGGSIVTQFFLQNILDFPLKEAIALDNAAVVGSELGLVLILLRKEKVDRQAIAFTAAILFGSYFGAQALRWIPESVLSIIFVGILLLVVLKIFFYKEKKTQVSKKAPEPIAFYSFAVAIGAYNAFLSIGDWIFGLLGMLLVFHLPYRRSIFLLAFSLFLGRALAATQYFSFGYIDLNFLIPMFISAFTAGVIAGTLLDHVKLDWIKPVLKVLALVLVVYLSVNLI